jgi:hypothetical protein
MSSGLMVELEEWVKNLSTKVLVECRLEIGVKNIVLVARRKEGGEVRG